LSFEVDRKRKKRRRREKGDERVVCEGRGTGKKKLRSLFSLSSFLSTEKNENGGVPGELK